MTWNSSGESSPMNLPSGVRAADKMTRGLQPSQTLLLAGLLYDASHIRCDQQYSEMLPASAEEAGFPKLLEWAWTVRAASRRPYRERKCDTGGTSAGKRIVGL